MGGDLVGMTAYPEISLARELGLCYSTIAMVTNYAAGVSETHLTHAEVLETMAANSANIKSLLLKALSKMPTEAQCHCSDTAAKM